MKTDITPEQLSFVEAMLSGNQPAVTFTNDGSTSNESNVQIYRDAITYLVQNSPTFWKMVKVIAQDAITNGNTLDIGIVDRMDGEALGRALWEKDASGHETRSVIFSGERASMADQLLFSIPNEFGHVIQMVAQSFGSKEKPTDRSMLELESDIISFQVAREVHNNNPDKLKAGYLGNHGWPTRFDGYDFRASRALGIDVEQVIAFSRKEQGLPPVNLPAMAAAANPLTQDPALVKVLNPRTNAASMGSITLQPPGASSADVLTNAIVSFDGDTSADAPLFAHASANEYAVLAAPA